MFGMVDTSFSNGRGLIVCSSLQEFSKAKESTLHVIWNIDTAFLLCEAEMHPIIMKFLLHHIALSCNTKLYWEEDLQSFWKCYIYPLYSPFAATVKTVVSELIIKSCLVVKKCPGQQYNFIRNIKANDNKIYFNLSPKHVISAIWGNYLTMKFTHGTFIVNINEVNNYIYSTF